MKIFDMHIHSRNKGTNPERLLAEMAAAGVYGGCVFSNAADRENPASGTDFESRMKEIADWTRGYEDRLFPVIRIHPYEDGIMEKSHMAHEAGAAAYKMICSDFYVYEDGCMRVLSEIAALGKPVIFHTGILWDGKVSSSYNRPLNWEALLYIEGIRFSMGHCSWPWHDECIALYGKFLHAKGSGKNVDMFFDITPGTPKIYREELLTKLLTVGYYVPDSIMFGTDCNALPYNSAWTKRWLTIDNAIYDKLGVGPNLRRKIYGENLMRFLGKSKNEPAKFKLDCDDQEAWTVAKEG